MQLINSDTDDPYINLATEEFLLKEKDDTIFRLWQNRPSVIIGKHQNPFAEINLRFIRENHIEVVRRLSGGGTVYHDQGNLNFTLITRRDKDIPDQFRQLIKEIISFLDILGIEAIQSHRNDLFTDGKKIGGTAGHIYRDNQLYHGTLLFSSDLAQLSGSLDTTSEKYTEKSVKSVKSEVANISKHLRKPMSMEDFRNALMNHIISAFSSGQYYQLSKNDRDCIDRLAIEKYHTWEWNYGYSPKYTLRRDFKTSSGIINIYLETERGIIIQFTISGDFFSGPKYQEIEQLMVGSKHDYEIIEQLFRAIPYSEYFPGLIKDEFLDGLF